LQQPLPGAIDAGQSLQIDLDVSLNGLSVDDIVVECIVGSESGSGDFTAIHRVSFEDTGQVVNGVAHYHCDLFQSDVLCSSGGLQHFRVRLFPWHRLLNHPFECGRMLWL